jgi:hypothetical protein
VGDSKIASRWLNATVPIYDGPDADHKGREICFDSAVTGFVTGSHTMSIVYGFQTTTRIFDVRDLDAPVLVDDVAHETTSIGHNTYSEGRYAFASNYTAGLRVFDITGVADGEMPQVAYFDVYPANDNASFEGGTWSNYPVLPPEEGGGGREHGLRSVRAPTTNRVVTRSDDVAAVRVRRGLRRIMTPNRSPLSDSCSVSIATSPSGSAARHLVHGRQ